MQELWKPIPSWRGFYSASSLGRIRRDPGSFKSPAGHILKPFAGKSGYLTVGPRRSGVKPCSVCVHLLVAEAFHGPRPALGYEVNHKDTNKLNNMPENLEWITKAANIEHALANGCMPRQKRGALASAAKLTDADVAEILRMVAERVYVRDIAATFGIGPTTINDIVRGARWEHVDRPNIDGRRIGRQVLTEADVRAIKGLLADGGISHGDIAKRFGVSGPTIWQIAAGRTWKHV